MVLLAVTRTHNIRTNSIKSLDTSYRAQEMRSSRSQEMCHRSSRPNLAQEKCSSRSQEMLGSDNKPA
jgi:hypothetical protein